MNELKESESIREKVKSFSDVWKSWFDFYYRNIYGNDIKENKNSSFDSTLTSFQLKCIQFESKYIILKAHFSNAKAI